MEVKVQDGRESRILLGMMIYGGVSFDGHLVTDDGKLVIGYPCTSLAMFWTGDLVCIYRCSLRRRYSD